MVETLFSSDLFVGTVLPFLLVFVLVFAILDKTKMFGDGKKRINALIALAIALIVISFSYATFLITSLIPFLAVGLVIILVFLLLWGAASIDNKEFKIDGWVKTLFLIVILIAVVIAVLYFTGSWDYIKEKVITGDGTSWVINIVMLLIIGAVIALATRKEEKSGSH